MKIIFRFITILLFIAFFGFALQNNSYVNLQFIPGTTMSGPLVLFLLGFFASGATLGVLLMVPSALRHRINASKAKKTLASMQKEKESQRPPQTQASQSESSPFKDH